MAIIKVGEPFEAKFQGKAEHRVEIAVAGMPVGYNVIKTKREIGPDDRFELGIKFTKEQHDEAYAAILEAIKNLNKIDGHGASDAELKEILLKAMGESTREPGTYRLYGSKSMGYADKETGEIAASSMPVYNGFVSPETLVPGGAILGKGSIVRSSFVVCLFKKKKQTCLRVQPKMVVILKKVDPPKREQTGIDHDGLTDTAYDY